MASSKAPAGKAAKMEERIAEATEPRPILVTCDNCFEDYEVRYEHGERVSAHKCLGVRPAPSATVLVL